MLFCNICATRLKLEIEDPALGGLWLTARCNKCKKNINGYINPKQIKWHDKVIEYNSITEDKYILE